MSDKKPSSEKKACTTGHSTSMNCDEDDEKSYDDPLFMEGLPKDFTTNPSLSALATLFHNDSDEDERKEPNKKERRKCSPEKNITCGGGGGKVSRRNISRSKHRSKPYYTVPKKSKTTLGEMQLFLKMWKM